LTTELTENIKNSLRSLRALRSNVVFPRTLFSRRWQVPEES